MSKNRREWVVFVEKWVGMGESGWDWVRVDGSAIRSSPLMKNKSKKLNELRYSNNL